MGVILDESVITGEIQNLVDEFLVLGLFDNFTEGTSAGDWVRKELSSLGS